jgi:CheY-like chemotaxis protein
MLQGTGYVLRHVATGQQAVALLQDWQPELILLDLIMGDGNMDGWSFRAYQHTQPWRALPVLVLTGFICTDEQEQALAAPVLMKPFSRTALLEHLSLLLG